jgi:hypothetical protein
MKMRLILVVLVIGLLACESAPPDEYSKAEQVLEFAYLKLVLNEQEKEKGYYARCRSNEFDTRHFIRCDINYPLYPHKGLWEVEIVNGKPVWYAINGKARGVLDAHFRNYPSEFKEHPRPNIIDIEALLENFEGANKPVVMKDVIEANKLISEEELSVYCAYKKDSDNLTSQANHLKLLPASEKRERWINPKLAALQKKYFATKGMNYDDLAVKFIKAQFRCPR